MELWNALEVKLSEEHNFGGLRKAMKKKLQVGEPMVPWFELINKARNSYTEYNDFLPSLPSTDPIDPDLNLLNFSKMYLTGELVLTFEKYKQSIEMVDLYHDEANKIGTILRTYLEHLPTYPDEILWKMSCRCEPGP